MLYKRYIPVVTLIGKEGEITPVSIIWEDINGQRNYKIDKIVDIRKAYSQVGGCGIRYECIISGKKRKLYYEKNRWFIESLKPY
ncbi:MAG: hypothetical protein ACI4P1_00585 [Erysipelotrichaceae bacterium]|nr:hypothetical protein [Bacillota bacterium]MDY3091510.1 hypothetical protein [Erysipelotrichaceae bacterium]